MARFEKGQSGNPNGKKLGVKHKITALLEDLMHDNVESALRVVIDAAKGGDLGACKVLLDRCLPARRSRPIQFDVPAGGDPVETINSVISAAACGELAPDEAAAVSAVLETRRRMVETAELESRIAAVERQLAERSR